MQKTKTDEARDLILKTYSVDKRIEQIKTHFETNTKATLRVGSLVESARAVVIVASAQRVNLVVCPTREEAPYMFHDISCLAEPDTVFYLPPCYKYTPIASGVDLQNVQLRTEALSQIGTSGRLTIVTCAEALTEKVVEPQEIQAESVEVSVGESLGMDFLKDTLLTYGFERTDFVYSPGQFSVRGSIIDVFSYAQDMPVRIDFLGDEVDSIRTFEIDTQLSSEKRQSVKIVPDVVREARKDNLVTLAKALGSDCAMWFVDRRLCMEMLDKQREAAKETPDEEKGISLADFCTADEWQKDIACAQVDIVDGKSGANINFDCVPQPVFRKNFDLLEDDIYYKSADMYRVFIMSTDSRQLQRIRAILSERKRKLKYDELSFSLHAGFIDKTARVCFYTDHQIFERYHRFSLRNDKARGQQQSITLRELSQLNIGDYVVHIDHGVGIFGGLVSAENNGKKYDAIRIQFAQGDMLLVNVQSMHKISKYRGKEGLPPKVNRLGGTHWEHLKERTKKKVKDIARELIALYAKRKAESGFAYSPDSFLQQELEASFLYEDTPDQYKANRAIKEDMESAAPMDRLVCGDVGFGKTELAVRAAFKATCDNKQVALLVPTTVLAFQHYNTFRNRLKDLPCTVEYVSRLRKAAEVRDVSKRLSDGQVDIVIGTHRLISKDIKFKDLGLLIIDEEQRFGVGVKEKLRQLKANVDTLTLSATPIPRTLQFSLMGARDLSILATPPANRQPIVTEVQTFTEEAVRDAIANEVERGGQVFVINNRIEHLFDLQNILARLMPEVRTVVAHGQMDGTKLESIMLDFMAGDYDVLLATTIIESGLDIPNANTIIVNNAHQFGLSELHQLRGRVGRSNRQAFCYLFAPPPSTLTPEARRRLQIIEQFSDLGAGFSIAMQDLDIRGAGNVLGAEQSGFITDLGYETYQKILNEAVLELKSTEFKDLYDDNEKSNASAEDTFVADTQVDTDEEILFPQEYISSIAERMRLYKELDNLSKDEAVDEFRLQLEDRFGQLPRPSQELLEVIKLRIRAQKLGIERVVFKDKKLTLSFVSNPQSAFYQSAVFGDIIGWIQTHSRTAQLRQNEQKLTCTIKNLEDMSGVRAVFDEILAMGEARKTKQH